MSGCSGNYNLDNLTLVNDPRYPRWLATDTLQTNQTSGISFLHTDKNGIKYFLLADDIGALHLLSIKNDTIFSVRNIKLSDEFKSYLKNFPKADFEAIEFDKAGNSFLLSIEGNEPAPEESTVILELKFNDQLYPDSLISFKELKIQPGQDFKKYIAANTCFEGIAADSRYIYLGLEGFVTDRLFADSTLLFIVDKNSLEIKRTISTKSLNIGTITGLVSDEDLSLWGIDRNSKNIFRLRLNSDLNIIEKKLFKVETHIPNYDSFDYVASLEAITLDNEKNIYLVDDPWWRFFIPDEEILKNLDSITVSRFRKYTPVIYRLHSVKQ
ncbi:MAG: hypothetical protein Kow0098_10660 [Ignavibacteriaceae bacterium]